MKKDCIFYCASFIVNNFKFGISIYYPILGYAFGQTCGQFINLLFGGKTLWENCIEGTVYR